MKNFLKNNPYSTILNYALVLTVVLWVVYEKSRSNRPPTQPQTEQVVLKSISAPTRKEKSRSSKPAQIQPAKEEAHSFEQILKSSDVFQKTVITHDQLMPESFGFIKIPLNRHENKLLVPVSLSLIESQNGFSSKLLRQATGFSENDSLLVSLESADPQAKTFLPLQYSIRLNKRYKDNIEHTFEVPWSDELLHLALYACIKSKNLPDCSSRKTIALSSDEKKNNSPANSTMFFQYLLISDANAYLMDSSSGAKRFYGLKQYLIESSSESSSERAFSDAHKRILKRGVLLNMLLRSPAIKPRNNTLGISLFGTVEK